MAGSRQSCDASALKVELVWAVFAKVGKVLERCERALTTKRVGRQLSCARTQVGLSSRRVRTKQARYIPLPVAPPSNIPSPTVDTFAAQLNACRAQTWWDPAGRQIDLPSTCPG